MKNNKSKIENRKSKIESGEVFSYEKLSLISLLVVWIILSLASPAMAVRVKEIADIQGVRKNQLIGYGLVIGLNGTGDSSTNIPFMVKNMLGMLERMGVTIPSQDILRIKTKNVATVIVTANLPPFAKSGSRIDVVVSSMGDCKSLQGGTLLITPLKGPDGEVYALAQGPMSIGGFAVSGAAKGVQKNHPTVGRIVEGAIIEKETSYNFNKKTEIFLVLHNPDFTTASRLSKAVNMNFKEDIAMPEDAGTVKVKVSKRYIERIVDFVTSIENIRIVPDVMAKVVIDERTGTVVMGENVRIATIAVAHGNLLIQIKEEPVVSQPSPISPGTTVVIPRTKITVEEGEDKLLVVPSGASIREVVTALNSIGVTPRDLIAILQSIKAAGALHAKLEII